MPAEYRPPFANVIHLAVNGMVVVGVGLLALAAWQAWTWKFHRRVPMTAWFLVPAALSGIAAILAMEFGWIVTEVGRQPWTVYGLLLTRDAVTASGGVPVTLAATLVIYGVLTFSTIGLPWLMSRRWRTEDPDVPEDDERVPYGPVREQVEEMPS